MNFFPGFKKSHGQSSELPQAAKKVDKGPSHMSERPKTGQPVSTPLYNHMEIMYDGDILDR